MKVVQKHPFLLLFPPIYGWWLFSLQFIFLNPTFRKIYKVLTTIFFISSLMICLNGLSYLFSVTLLEPYSSITALVFMFSLILIAFMLSLFMILFEKKQLKTGSFNYFYIYYFLFINWFIGIWSLLELMKIYKSESKNVSST